MSSSFPRNYSVPRGGRIVEVTVRDRDALRELRTELELLRRVDWLTSRGKLSHVALSEDKHTSKDRRELSEILADARSPAVKACVAIVDQEFDDLRKELLMSVVHEQAEKLAYEAAESGAALDAMGDAPPTVEQALDAAEAELAKIAALSGTAPSQPSAFQEPVTVAAPTPHAEPIAAPPIGATVANVAAAVAVDKEIEGTTGAFTPERAEQVVSEIEAGIRKLAGILSSEVHEQWKNAEAAFHQVVDLRGRTEQAYQNTSIILTQIAHLKEEMEIARDDAEVTRREAKLLRDDARRAKERAEVAAAACLTLGASR
jgi:hypothetical protein